MSIRRHVRVLALFGAAIVVALIVAIPRVKQYFWPEPPGTGKPPQRITIAVPLYLGYEPLHYGVATGYWKKAGVDLALMDASDVGVIAASLKSNSIDATMTTVDAVIHQKVEGLPGKIVMVVDKSAGADGIAVRNSAKVNTVADLTVETKIGLQIGTASHYFLLKRLRETGSHGDQLKIRDLPPEQIVPAVDSGNIDVAVTWHPFLAELARRPGMRVIDDTRQSKVSLYDVVYVTDSSLEKKKKEWRAFAEAWFALTDSIAKDPVPFSKFLDEKYGEQAGQPASKLLDGIKFLTSAENVYVLTTHGQLDATVDDISALFRDANVIRRNVTAESVISPVLVQNDE